MKMIKKSELQKQIYELKDSNVKSKNEMASLKDEVMNKMDIINKENEDNVKQSINLGFSKIEENNKEMKANFEKKMEEQSDFLYHESTKRQNEMREFKEEQNRILNEELSKEVINREKIYEECKDECKKQINESKEEISKIVNNFNEILETESLNREKIYKECKDECRRQIEDNRNEVTRIIDNVNEEQRKTLDAFDIRMNAKVSDMVEAKVKATEINDITEKAIDKMLEAFNNSLTDVNVNEKESIAEAVKKLYLSQIKTSVVEEKIEPLGKEEILHENYEMLKHCVTNGVYPILVGPAGTGKSHVVGQLARDLGLHCYMANRVHDSYDLTGFVNAAGDFVTTPFYEAFTKGGLFLFDEIDASNPQALVTVNTAVAQGEMAFPGHANTVKMHKDFRIVCAANTYGTGANKQYTGRNKLDASTLDRFFPIDWGYSKKLEEQKIEQDSQNGKYEKDNDLLEIFWAIRDAVETLEKEIVVSTRSLLTLNKLIHSKDNPFSISSLFKQKLFASVESDDIEAILDEVKEKINKDNKYIIEMEKLIQEN